MFRRIQCLCRTRTENRQSGGTAPTLLATLAMLSSPVVTGTQGNVTELSNKPMHCLT